MLTHAVIFLITINNCILNNPGRLCNHSQLNCATHNCSHDCIDLPTGPRCICPAGYHNINEKVCLDINECEEYGKSCTFLKNPIFLKWHFAGICDQNCKNLPGSYECFCEHKYMLQEDKRTCKAIGGEATMIFSSKTQIR